MADETVTLADKSKEIAELARGLVFTSDAARRNAAMQGILDLVEQENRGGRAPDPQQGRDERAQALGAVLADIAGACYSIKMLVAAAIDEGGTTDGAVMLEGLEALAMAIGVASRAEETGPSIYETQGLTFV